MKRVKGIVLPLLVAVFVFGGALALTWAQDVPALSGITVEDAHPNGCIDCHRSAGANDYRLNVSLKAAGHPDITAMVKTVPTDCAICHKANTPLQAISQQVHKAHYQNPSENHFVTAYSGECLACHTLNTATGVMTVKSAPKNW